MQMQLSGAVSYFVLQSKPLVQTGIWQGKCWEFCLLTGWGGPHGYREQGATEHQTPVSHGKTCRNTSLEILPSIWTWVKCGSYLWLKLFEGALLKIDKKNRAEKNKIKHFLDVFLFSNTDKGSDLQSNAYFCIQIVCMRSWSCNKYLLFYFYHICCRWFFRLFILIYA